MPVTLSYDLSDVRDANDRTYVRSMFERFHWRRLGGSVFRYEGVFDASGRLQEDWLNHVAPSLMYFRSFILSRRISLTKFTLDAASVTYVDHSDPASLLGNGPASGDMLDLTAPTNSQSSEAAIREFLDAATRQIEQ